MTYTSKFTKIALGTAAAGMMATAAVPAQAADRYDRRGDGIGVGEIIAGVAILGGLAAILSSGNRDRDYRGGTNGYDDPYYNNGYNDGYDQQSYGGSRAAVQQCVAATQNEARRYGQGRVRITDITDIDRNRGGYTINGRLQVQDYNRGYGNRYDSRYDNRYDRRSRVDNGSFRCKVRNGRVVDVDIRGIR
ncbi:hypothetical protein FSZ31_12320 [Sphingorhabdus soli]|uniref:17 kDa surface antigen n=1 Tax=Flavisphingopyxis soli TaxID=2601267 RepID=A0A5C6U7Q9_9SPHN|nr:hypothetical protein [Sphingorhabdus soli]TXC67755.1 hypothetical protein FSZ31_12320 [Sphingorhabdus soli]